MCLHCSGDRTQSLLGDKRAVSSGSIIPQEEGYTETPPEPRMEESFTIHLGKEILCIYHSVHLHIQYKISPLEVTVY